MDTTKVIQLHTCTASAKMKNVGVIKGGIRSYTTHVIETDIKFSFRDRIKARLLHVHMAQINYIIH